MGVCLVFFLCGVEEKVLRSKKAPEELPLLRCSSISLHSRTRASAFTLLIGIISWNGRTWLGLICGSSIYTCSSLLSSSSSFELAKLKNFEKHPRLREKFLSRLAGHECFDVSAVQGNWREDRTWRRARCMAPVSGDDILYGSS